jgi:LysR family transcriptional regulator of gallate degradation
VLAELRHIPEDIAALAGVVQGVVTIGALPLARSQLLPTAIAAVLRQHPRLQVRSLESPYDELTAGLLSGRIDFIIGALRASAGDAFARTALFRTRRRWWRAPAIRWRRRKRLALDDLAGYPWVLSRAGTPLRESLVQLFPQPGRAAAGAGRRDRRPGLAARPAAGQRHADGAVGAPAAP